MSALVTARVTKYTYRYKEAHQCEYTQNTGKAVTEGIQTGRLLVTCISFFLKIFIFI